MSMTEHLVQGLGRGAEIVRGIVLGIAPSGQVLVLSPGEAGGELLCDVLITGGPAPSFDPGDIVLVLRGRDDAGDAIVLGGIGRATLPDESPAEDATPARPGSQRERRIVIEADEELILRVGESSIRIARDGKVVIRGQHVLTRAKGTNRIKGASVAIN